MKNLNEYIMEVSDETLKAAADAARSRSGAYYKKLAKKFDDYLIDPDRIAREVEAKKKNDKLSKLLDNSFNAYGKKAIKEYNDERYGAFYRELYNLWKDVVNNLTKYLPELKYFDVTIPYYIQTRSYRGAYSKIPTDKSLDNEDLRDVFGCYDKIHTCKYIYNFNSSETKDSKGNHCGVGIRIEFNVKKEYVKQFEEGNFIQSIKYDISTNYDYKDINYDLWKFNNVDYFDELPLECSEDVAIINNFLSELTNTKAGTVSKLKRELNPKRNIVDYIYDVMPLVINKSKLNDSYEIINTITALLSRDYNLKYEELDKNHTLSQLKEFVGEYKKYIPTNTEYIGKITIDDDVYLLYDDDTSNTISIGINNEKKVIYVDIHHHGRDWGDGIDTRYTSYSIHSDLGKLKKIFGDK